MKCKVLQINTVYETGSTGKITSAINSLLEDNGYVSYVAYGRGTKIRNPNFYKIGNRLDFLIHVSINCIFGKNGFGSKYVTRKFLKWVDKVKPDIIHLHNIHGFYINIEILFEYIKKNNIPVVWTLHDCWSFTGQCAHFDYAKCDKWKKGCYQCPIFRTNYPYSIFKDNSSLNYINKKEIFCNVSNMTIVTPSEWLAEKVKDSFLKEYNVVVMNNGIDLEIFRPYKMDKYKDKKIILAVANIWDERKGFSYIKRLSDELKNCDEYKLVVIGLNKRQIKILNKVNSYTLAIEHVSNQTELAKWYSVAYVYINPTLEDNFPTTNLEALACGTPVITFETGGSPESIDCDTGIVVPKDDYEKLLLAIKNINTTERSRNKCRENALRYNYKECFNPYLDMYKGYYDKSY